MASNAISTLFVEFAADTKKFSAAMGEVSKTAKEVDKILKPIKDRADEAGKALTVGFSLPLLALGGSAVAAAMKIDEAFDTIRAATGKTGDDLIGLQNDFKATFAGVPNTIEDTTTAISTLSQRTGLAGKPLQDLATQMLNLSRVTKTEIGETVSGATRIFGNWSIATDKQASALDYLFKVGQQSGVKFSQLSQSIVQFGVPLREMGFSFETAAALLGKFEKEGVNTEAVLASMKKALATFAKAGITDAGAALEEITKQIKAAGSAGEANAVAIKIFGAKAGPEMAAAIREGRFELAEFIKGINASPDTINKAAAATLSFADKFARLKNEAILALEPLGTRLLDVFERLIPVAERGLARINQLAESFANLKPGTQDAIIGIVAFLGIIGPALSILVKMSSTIVGLTTSLVTLASSGFTAVSGVISALPLLGAVKSFGDLSAAVSLIGGTSIAATAGLVALAAAIGVGIGLLANWALKATGLEQSFDKALKKAIDFIPVVGKWATGQNEIANATAMSAKAAKDLTAEFAKYGVVVDQARLGDASYISGLKDLVLERNKGAIATREHAAETAKAKDAAAAAAGEQAKLNKLLQDDAAKEAAKKMAELRKEFEQSLAPANALNIKFDQLRAAGVSNIDITKAYAEEIVKAAATQREHGIAIVGTTATLLQQATALVATQKAMKIYKDYMKDHKEIELTAAPIKDALPVDAFQDSVFAVMDSVTKAKTDITDLNKVIAAMNFLSPAEQVAQFGAQVKKADADSKIYGGTLSAQAKAILENSKDMDAATAAQTKFQEAANKGIDAMKNNRIEIDSTNEAIKRMRDAHYSTAQIVAVLGDNIQSMAEKAKLLGIPLGEDAKQLLRLSEAASKSVAISKQFKDAWSTAVGNITSAFAEATANTLFSGEKFSVGLKNIFKDLGKSLIKILVTDTFTSIAKSFTKMLGGMGGSGGGIGGLLSGLTGAIGKAVGIGGAGAAAGGAAGAGSAASGIGGAAGIAGLGATTLGIGAAVAGAVLLANHFIGAGRKQADTLVQTVQNPFDRQLGSLLAAFDSAKKSGTLTIEDAKATHDAITTLWQGVLTSSATFAAEGKNQAKVVNQMFASFAEGYGPNLEKVLGGVDETIGALQTKAAEDAKAAADAATAQATANLPGGAGIPQTGLATSASQIFAAAVARFDEAVNRGGGQTAPVTVQYTVAPTFTFYGTPESLQKQIIEQIEPTLLEDLKNNARGFTEDFIKILSKAQGGVVTAAQPA